MIWKDEFQNPPARNRIKPFWFWNGDMDKKEIDFQLKEIADKGLGGAFICARQGLGVPYLSEEWFERIGYAVRRAEQYGIEAWLYDEYPYPSGMAGGEVLLRHPEAEYMVLEHRRVILEDGGEFEVNTGWSEILYAKAFPWDQEGIRFDKGLSLKPAAGNLQTGEIYQTTGLTEYNHKRYFSYRPEHIFKGMLPKGHWQIELYFQRPLGDFKYYGSFFDPCSEEAVKTFLDVTHERYKDYMGGQFGGRIKGMFSDEVGLLGRIPWSKRLPEYFRKTKGYDLTEHLPALHCASYPDAMTIRYDLYDAVHRLFVESYHAQVAGWCKDNHLEYATEVPSMRMTTQRHSTIAGGDTAHEKLGKPLEWIYDTYIPNYRSNAKAVSSLARQLGREFAMIESFHSVGWSMTLQDAKWMFDRLAASGINFYNVHAFYYTIASLTKHDAPPSQFFQNPYWKYYRKLADYAGRLSVWISNTEAEIHTAVLDPTASLWACLGNPFSGFAYGGEEEEEKKVCDAIRDQWVLVCKELLFHQIEYDHLDAEILAEAVIKNGEIRIGKASYRVLVLPPTPYLEKEAYQKILEFADCGGTLVCLGELPKQKIGFGEPTIDWSGFGWNEASGRYYVPDIHSGGWCSVCREAAGAPFDIRVEPCAQKEVISSVRRDREGLYVFLANQGKQKVSVSISPGNPDYASVCELCPDSGETRPVEPAQGRIDLKPYESRLFAWSLGKESAAVRRPEGKKLILSTAGELPVRIDGQNVFRMERFSISRDQKRWYEVPAKTFVEQCAEQPVLGPEDYHFTGAFGIPKSITIGYPLTVFYRTEVTAETLPGSLGLLMDAGAIREDYTIFINGMEVALDTARPIFVNDRNNRIYDILPYMKEGRNQFEIKVAITKDSDGIRDPLYLYGDFGVECRESECVITRKAERAGFDLDYIRGYPYYAGTFHFKVIKEVEEIPETFELELDVGEQCHDCLEISINGTPLGARCFSPYIWKGDGAMLKKGENEVEICRTNTLSGMLDGTWFDDKKHCVRRMMDQ